MNTPAVSIIVPVFDVEDHVAAAIASLRDQSFADFEAIVVDDGSTDASADRAAAAIGDDPRFTLIRQANRGLSGARNTGLARVRAPVVGFLDSDDIRSRDCDFDDEEVFNTHWEKETVYDLDDLFREYDSSFEETDDESSEYGVTYPIQLKSICDYLPVFSLRSCENGLRGFEQRFLRRRSADRGGPTAEEDKRDERVAGGEGVESRGAQQVKHGDPGEEHGLEQV